MIRKFSEVEIFLQEVRRNTSWMESGKCLQSDSRAYYSRGPAKTKGKNAIKCGGCTVQEQCLLWAAVTDTREGVWGGMSAAFRNANRNKIIVRAMRAAGIEPVKPSRNVA